MPQASSTAIYVLYADKGNWTRTTTNGTLALYSNPAAGTVIVLAMPHNITTAANAKATARALTPEACLKTVDTTLDYPPNATSAVVGNQTVPLGYDPANSLVRSQLRVTTQQLAGFSCRNGLFVSFLPALQMVFPHHLKAMPAAQKKQIIRTPDQLAYKYIWNTLLGPAYGYQGNSIVQELPTYGVLPFLPSAAISPNAQNRQSAAEDLYETMKNWFFVEEQILPTRDNNGNLVVSHLNSFTRNIGNYVNAATNTYIPGTTTLREGIIIADQLAQSSTLGVTDPQLGKSKQAVSSEMRDELLQSLKEIIGQWADIYTSQLFQYNPAINSIYGYPAGYGAVGSINDHHFHYGYFLRAAVAIGRYDKAWLQSYLPLLNELRMDVANFDRSSTRYPVLRNFNPFYGHSWADGKAYSQNQESSSEAINFAVGLIELGELLNKKDWRDLGLYLYEQEILATNQYFFNQDATLAATPPTPPYSPLRYNGNWPEQFVTYTGPDATTWHTTLLGRLFPMQLDRGTFFGPIDTTYAIQQVPLDASALYFGRNQNWLAATWEQYKLDTGIVPVLSGVYENIVSSMQARLPASGSDVNGTGLTPALTRINTLHQFFPGAVNTAAKHWAYTNATLGQVDTSVVADIPDYAVFSANGTQTFVAYNPTNADVSVTFKVKATGAVAAVVSVPANSMVTQVQGGSSPIVDRLSLFDPNPPGRLYLRSEGVLNPQPGTWMLPTPGTSPPFPTDTSAIQASLLTVPVRGDGGQPPVPPAPAKILTWKGHFSGNLVGTTGPNDPNCQPPPGFTKPGCDPAKTLQAVTHMAIYTDQCLYPGWQRCQKTETDGNTITARVSYYFDTATCDPVKGDTCTADRVETYGNVALQARDNTFIGNNKITEYYFAGVNLAKPAALLTSGFNGSFGLNLGDPSRPGIVLPPASCTPSPCGFFSANGIPIPPGGVFPQQVNQGALVVELWGGTPAGTNIMRPVPVSVDASPLLNRASWIKPPYN